MDKREEAAAAPANLDVSVSSSSFFFVLFLIQDSPQNANKSDTRGEGG